jgi:Transglycosylase-like domain
MSFLMIVLALAVPAPQKGSEAHTRGHCGYKCHVIKPYNRKLNRMAWCESTGRWFVNTGNGFYGGLQFDLSTWRSVGGRGYPHQNSILEQKYRAVRLIWRRGYRPWPVCGYV